MKRVHLMGIGGMGMSSLAGLFYDLGWAIQGSDRGKIYAPASDALAEMNAKYTESFSPESIDKNIDLAVIGNIVSEGNEEFERIKELEIPYMSMAAAVREYFIKEKQGIMVTGTHGKTTTTTLLSFLLSELGSDPGYFIGGKPLQLDKAHALGTGDYFVIEGDEYHSACFERSPKFHHYGAQHVIMNNLEFDHADIYNSVEEIEAEFVKLRDSIPEGGTLFYNADDERLEKLVEGAKLKPISFGSYIGWDWSYQNEKTKALGSCSFDVFHEGVFETQLTLSIQGTYNVMNALVAYGMLRHLGFESENIKSALKQFKGVRKRQEFKGEAKGVKIYEDFAHHPTAVSQTLDSFSKVKPEGGKLWAVFEPRSGSARRNIFQNTWPNSFMKSDYNIIAPVFNSGKGVSNLLDTKQLEKDIQSKGKHAHAAISYDEIENTLKQGVAPGDVVVFMSSGDFGNLPNRLLEAL